MKKGYSNRKPWLSEALRNCIKCKNKLYHVYKKVPSVKNEICYKKYKNKLTHILLKAEKQYYHDLLNKHKDNMRKSWSIIKYIIHKNKKIFVSVQISIGWWQYDQWQKVNLRKI